MWGFDDKEYFESEVERLKKERSDDFNELSRLRTENRKLREENERLLKLVQGKTISKVVEFLKCERCEHTIDRNGNCMCQK